MRLPSHIQAYRECIEASDLCDHAWATQDRDYRLSLKHGTRPEPWMGGEFDVCDSLTGRKPSCPAEVFSRLCREYEVTSWSEVQQVIDTMRRIDGFEGLRLPQDRIDQIIDDLSPELLEQSETVSPELLDTHSLELLDTTFSISPSCELSHSFVDAIASVGEAIARLSRKDNLLQVLESLRGKLELCEQVPF